MHIFISYAKDETRSLAQQVSQALATIPDVTLWWDNTPGASEALESKIQHEIDYCEVLVVLISPAVHQMVEPRTGVIKEVLYAQKRKKTVLPVLAKPTPLPSILSHLRYHDLTQNPNAGIRKLVAELREREGRGDTSTIKIDETQKLVSEYEAALEAADRRRRQWWVAGAIGLMVLLAVVMFLLVQAGG